MLTEIKQKLDKVWPDWEVVRLIGKGSYGAVYEIRKVDFGEVFTAALKVISVPPEGISAPPGMTAKDLTEYYEDMSAGMMKEYHILSKMKGNSNIVSYEDHVRVMNNTPEEGWSILIRMELLTPFSEYMENHKLERVDVIQLGIDICKALEACKKYHVIHRDIKPSNLFVSPFGDYKLGDFGTATMLEKTGLAGTKMGTALYMAPEVYANKPYDASVDTYALGLVLYQLLNNNRIPFMDGKYTYSAQSEALAKRMSGEPVPSPANADEQFSNLLKKACAFDPASRFQSPEEMRIALEALRNGPIIMPVQKVKIRFLDDRGATVTEREYNMGDRIHIPDAPQKRGTRKYNWAFQGWKPQVPEFAEVSADYSAVYEKERLPGSALPRKKVGIAVGSAVALAVLIIGLVAWKPWETNNNEPEVQQVEETAAPKEENIPEPEPVVEVQKPEETTPEEKEPITYSFGDDVCLNNTSFLRGNEHIYAAKALNEQYCVVYTAFDTVPTESDPVINGEVYFVEIEGGNARSLYNGINDATAGASFRPWYPIQLGDTVLFGCTDNYTFLYSTHLWKLANDGMSVEKVAEDLGALTYIGDTDVGDYWFETMVSVDDQSSNVDGTGFSGRTWKKYWLYWDAAQERLREFAGAEMSAAELKNLRYGNPAIEAFLYMLEQSGYQFHSAFLRGNGKLNINYCRQDFSMMYYYHETFQNDHGLFSLENGGNPGEKSGLYLTAAFPEIAEIGYAEDLKAALVAPMVSASEFSVFEHELTGISCPYPSHFKSFNVSDSIDFVRRFSDLETGECIEIYYHENESPISGEEAMNAYIDQNKDKTIAYSACGKSWYAVSISTGEVWIYRKAILRNEGAIIAWFDYTAPNELNGDPDYTKRVEYLEANFTIQN